MPKSFRYVGRFIPRRIKKGIETFGIAILMLSIPAIVPECLFHYNFGRKHLTWFRLVIASTRMTIAYLIWTHGIKILNWWLLPPHPPTIWGVGFLSLFIGVALFHRIQTSIRRWTNKGGHAYDRGTSIFKILGLPDYPVYGIFEPWLILAIAVHVPDSIVQAWLCITSTALWLKVHCELFFFQWQKDEQSSSEIEAEMEGQDGVKSTGSIYVTKIVAKPIKR